MKPFVTVSASFGAGGSEIAPAIATRLEVPFFDRAIPAQVASVLGTSTDDPMLREERASGLFERLLGTFASTAPLYVAAAALPPDLPLFTEQEYRGEVDRVIRAAAAGSGGGVLLGRAGAVVLADHPHALHVRLDAPQARRLERVRAELAIDEKSALAELRDTDAAREAYVKQLYGVDARDPGLYHLIVDTTRIPDSACVELIAVAARARAMAAGPVAVPSL